MKRVTILYPNGEGATFDYDYYVRTHMPMVAKVLGGRYEVRRGLSAPGGKPAPFLCQVSIAIESVEAFGAAMKEHGAALMADVPNFTNVRPVMQFDEVVG